MRTIGLEFPERGRVAFCDLGPPPDPVAHQVVLRTIFSGITNGTERHALLHEHAYGSFPGRHGYQHVSVVERVGAGVSTFEVGDRVFDGHYVGHRAWNIVDLTEQSFTVKLRPDADLPAAALFGVAGVAVRAVRVTDIRPGDHVWVVGAGLIGQFAAQGARLAGATVIVSDIDETRLERASQLGAHGVALAGTSGDQTALDEGGPYDSIIDCSSAENLFFEIHERDRLAERGTIVALATRAEATFPWSLLHLLEGSIRNTVGFRRRDLEIVRDWCDRGDLQIDPLITHRVSIDDAPDIYRVLRDEPHLLGGVVFDWS